MFFKKTLEDRVEKAKKDKQELNCLIDEYKPFIAHTAQKKTGRYLRYGHDDELAVGMLAFKEAIDAYDRKKGKFLSFAKGVIDLRLIDYFRKEQKQKRIVYIGGQSSDEDERTQEIGNQQAVMTYHAREDNEIRKLEIMEYKKALQEWDIELSDLVKVSPKQKKLRELYKNVARAIVEEEDILNDLLRTKRLPIKKIQDLQAIHRKKLERGRIYIIALVLVWIGDYNYMRDYIDGR